MKKTLILLFVTALTLTSCGGKPTDTPIFVISDAGKNIEVTAGNEFKIVIEANPSTGYHWEIIGELDEAVVQFVSREYRPQEPAMPGASGKEAWVFKAVAAGEATVTLGYYPPSSDLLEPAQTVTFTIVVK